jgi:hypothetical protein
MRRFHYLSTSAAQWYCVAATVAWLMCNVQLASATPITYFYSGTGYGQLGNSTFSDAHFAITALADTSNITSWIYAAGGPQNTHLSAVIDITGLGSFSITTPSHSWMNESPYGLGGLGEDHDANWLTLREDALTHYGLNTPIGPVVENSPEDFEQVHGVSTSGGALTFSYVSTVSFTAIVAPEPSTLLLLGIGAISLLGYRKAKSHG